MMTVLRIMCLLVLLCIVGFSHTARAAYVTPLSTTMFTCFGMYSEASIPGALYSPSIKLTVEVLEGLYSFVIYNYADSDLIGFKDEQTGFRSYLCSPLLHKNDKCYGAEVDEFIVNNATTNVSLILSGGSISQPISDRNDIFAEYSVRDKGFYCVMFVNSSIAHNMNGNLQVLNPYGSLPADRYPYLPFYGLLGLTYLIIGILWGILTACYWREILHVQNYISGIIFLCMLEMTFHFSYYANFNETGIPSNALFSISVILNSARNSASFVALLVVCMGYGLVKPTLGSTAYKVFALGFVHFICGTLFAATANSQKIMALLFVFPLAVTLTLFYTWTFNSLTVTIKKLEIRRQSEKTRVYRRLWRLLMFSIFVLFIFLILTIIQRYDDDYVKKNWDSMWFTTDGWIHLLYFFMFVVMLFMWRPQKNNARYGMSEVPQDDEEDTIATGSGTTQLKMRSLKKKGTKINEEDDALQWVEDNISDTEEPGVLTLDDAAEEKVARREMSKMN